MTDKNEGMDRVNSSYSPMLSSMARLDGMGPAAQHKVIAHCWFQRPKDFDYPSATLPGNKRLTVIRIILRADLTVRHWKQRELGLEISRRETTKGRVRQRDRRRQVAPGVPERAKNYTHRLNTHSG